MAELDANTRDTGKVARASRADVLNVVQVSSLGQTSNFMAHKRKDTFTKPKEWAKHLRPYGKRVQAKAERRMAKKIVKAEV